MKKFLHDSTAIPTQRMDPLGISRLTDSTSVSLSDIEYIEIGALVPEDTALFYTARLSPSTAHRGGEQ